MSRLSKEASLKKQRQTMNKGYYVLRKYKSSLNPKAYDKLKKSFKALSTQGSKGQSEAVKLRQSINRLMDGGSSKMDLKRALRHGFIDNQSGRAIDTEWDEDGIAEVYAEASEYYRWALDQIEGGTFGEQRLRAGIVMNKSKDNFDKFLKHMKNNRNKG